MSVVHDASQTGGAGMNPLRLAGVVVAVAVIAIGALTWSSDGPSSRPVGEVAPAVGPLRVASCRDWNRATGPQRLGTVHQLARLSGGPVPGVANARGPQLDDQDAYAMLERSCAPEYARAFKLYKLYGRSAAFVGH